MRIPKPFRLLPLLALALVSSGAVRQPAERMFPAFVMFRGGGLTQPVVMGHSNVRKVTINNRDVGDLSNDPLAILYSTLKHANVVPPDAPGVLRIYEVAEFFGPPWSGMTDSTGKPKGDIRFDDANHFSRIYVMRDQRVIWDKPVVAPGGGEYSLLFVSDTSIAILRRLGLSFQ